VIEDLAGRNSGDIAADVCVVGAGAAGVSIALALAQAGLRVCLLEGGGLTAEPESQALYQGVSVGHPMSLDEERFRVFGGATTHWTGRCATLDPIDLEQRPWLGCSGWPITHADLAPWYARALPMCGFKQPWIKDADAAAALGAPLPAFNRDEIELFAWRYAIQPGGRYLDWGALYRRDIEAAPNITALLHANVVAIRDEDGRISAVTARALSGAHVTVQARAFVLCCGGIENARLLLANPIGAPGAHGNRHDQIGRYFMQHLRGPIATLDASAERIDALQQVFNVLKRRGAGLQYEFGFALAEATQRRERLLNASAILSYQGASESGWESAKAAVRDLREGRVDWSTVGHAARATADSGDVARNLGRRLTDRHPVLRTRSVTMVVDLEQEPDPESRITLDDARDALGAPRARVDWRVGARERQTARVFAQCFASEAKRLDLGHITPAAWLDGETPITPDQLSATNHHIGATRMSRDPHEGVVDADCRVHGVDNLYVAGSSTFSTGGHANPTFTIVALALRLADHLTHAIKRA